jgi:tyrosinase
LINLLTMKTKYIAFIYVAILLLISNDFALAQRIRKDHREMTPAEKTAYVNALIVLRDNGTLTMIGDHHASHFTSPIHSTTTTNGEFFLPWHRIFAIEMENYIRGTSAAASSLCVPYWDWRLENTAANVTWDDAGFLQLSAINSASYTITRSLGTTNTLATSSDVTNMLAIPTLLSAPAIGLKSATVNLLTYRMEFWHDKGHNFIGGTMGGSASPRDPIFFLHHNFVDKLWQEWYDSDNGVAKTDYLFTTPSSSYWMWPGITANEVKDSRFVKFQATTSSPVTQEEVWYAYNGKLVLDGVRGAAFNVTGTNRLYCYTAWNGTIVKGEIFAGDVKRDANDKIIADNRGGIKIKSGATCAFKAGSAITMLPGFESEYGAVFEASIVSLPCGFNVLRPAEELTTIEDVDVLNTYNQLSVYSESGSNNLVVNYTLGSNSRVTLQLYNMMGQQVYSTSMGEQSQGVHQNNITLQLANGVYLCKLITDNSQQTVKFVY